MKNLLSKFAVLAAAMFCAGSFNAMAMNRAVAETYVYPEVEETSPFNGVRITGINQRVQNILGTGGGTKHLWSVDGKPSGIVNLDMAVEESDWSEATAMRIRLKSNQLPEAPTNAQDNNIAVGFGVKSAHSDKIVLKMNAPYGKMSFQKRSGQQDGTLYFINNEIPYFSMGRLMNTYVTGQLKDATFVNLTDYVQSTPNGDTWYQLYSENVQNNIFDYIGEYDTADDSIYTGQSDKDGHKLVRDSEVDMTNVKFVFIRLEPQNYANMCLDIGDVEILVNGEWQTAVDMSKVSVAEKQTEKTWYQTVTSLRANECILDPTYESGATTEAFKLKKIEAKACDEHFDDNLDGMCDRCFEYMPHELYDLGGDGICDDCGRAICGEGVCKDEDGDGGCDVCFHTDYVEQPAPKPPVNPEDSDSENSDKNQGKGSEKHDSGCGSVIGGLAALPVLGAVFFVVYEKRKK